MSDEATQLSTQIVAWWGAIIATTILLWDIYKWKKSGVDLRVRICPNMEIFGGHEPDENTYVMVVVVNRGDRATTITHLTAYYFKDKLSRIRKKADKSMFITDPSPSQPIPHKLNPGEQWMGMIIQDEELEQRAKSGILCVSVVHTGKEKLSYQQINIPEDNA